MTVYLPRVSDVLSLLYPGSLAFVSPEALARGSQAHEEMERWALNTMAEEPYEPSPLVQPMVGWLQDEEFVPCHMELPLTSPHHYQGHLDVIGNFRDEDWLLDYKFAEDVTEQNRMQIEAYYRMARAKKLVDRAGLLQCRADGTVTLWKHRTNTSLWHAFLAGVSVLRFQQARRIDMVLDEITPLKGVDV